MRRKIRTGFGKLIGGNKTLGGSYLFLTVRMKREIDEEQEKVKFFSFHSSDDFFRLLENDLDSENLIEKNLQIITPPKSESLEWVLHDIVMARKGEMNSNNSDQEPIKFAEFLTSADDVLAFSEGKQIDYSLEVADSDHNYNYQLDV